MQKIQKRKSKGRIIAAILLLLLALIIGGGIYAWHEFLKINAENSVGQTVIKQSGDGEGVAVAKVACQSGEDTSASSGMFCSEDMGFKLFVPKLFVGNLVKAGNYQVYRGGLNPGAKTAAGTSLHVYRATGVSNGTFTLTIAQEPMRTGYIDMYHAGQNTYFDAATKTLSKVNAPTIQYSQTTPATPGAFTKGDPIPSFLSGTVKYYEGATGDAGQRDVAYMTIVGDTIVKISLETTTQAAQNAATKAVFEELNKSLRTLQVL